jgi:hypothetical protein
MRTSLAILVISVSLASVTRAQAGTESSNPVVGTGQYVLVSGETWLHAGPSKRSFRTRLLKRLPPLPRPRPRGKLRLVTVRRGGFSQRQLPDPPRRVFVFERLAGQQPDGGWVAIRSIPSRKKGVIHSCGFPKPGREVDFVFYVQQCDLLWTLVRPWQYKEADGTSVELMPGIALRPGGKGRYLAETPYLSLTLSLKPDQVAQSFDGARSLSVKRANNWGRGLLRLKVGTISVLLHRPEIGLDAVKPPMKNALITYLGGCARVTGRGRYIPLGRKPSSTGIAGILSEMGHFRGYSARKDTVVYWPSGRRAGTLRRDFRFEHGEGSWIRRKRRCFKRDWLGSALPQSLLCFDPADLTHHP